MTKSRNVPGQAEGYFFQETRFFFHLLSAKSGDTVFLEYFGDVATVHSDGSITSEEDKSAIEDNPITDRSVNLWKTFYNWALSVEEGVLDINQTFFVIYVPSPKFEGKFIEAFNKANSIEEAKSAISCVKNELWGKPTGYKPRKNVSESISKYVTHFFDNEDLVAKIIFRFKYEKGDVAGYAEIDLNIKDSVVPNEYCEIYQTYMLGWIKKRIDILISRKKPAQISRDEFINEGKAYLRKLNREELLRSVSEVPSHDKIKNQIDKKPKYIRQLDYINLEIDEKLNAVCDFLRAKDDTYDWVERGLIHTSSAEEFEGNLLRTWANIKGEIKATQAALPPCSQGAAIYFRCKQHNTKIENYFLQPHFISGTYHLLADKPLLGWHPDWSTLLSKDDKNGE